MATLRVGLLAAAVQVCNMALRVMAVMVVREEELRVYVMVILQLMEHLILVAVAEEVQLMHIQELLAVQE